MLLLARQSEKIVNEYCGIAPVRRAAGFSVGFGTSHLFLSGVVGATGALADDDDAGFRPKKFADQRSVYDNHSGQSRRGDGAAPRTRRNLIA